MIPPDPNLNALWCRCIAEELHRAGVAAAVLCPGSRNSPLLFACAGVWESRCLSHVDERSAGFLALGMIRATGHPAAVCVTSGSALANLIPALTEADAAGLPLVAVSADRPWEQLNCGAPQTTAQRGVLDPWTRATLALGEPLPTAAALRALRAQVARLAQRRDGPVHLNVPLRDPLPPLPDPAWQPAALPPEAVTGRGDGQPFTLVATRPEVSALPDAPWLRPGLRGLIVAGAAGARPADLAHLAERTGFPLLADAPSGLRRPELPGLVCTGDALLTGALAGAEPELVIQVGAVALARPVAEWLARRTCPWVALEDAGNQDALARAWWSLPAGAATCVRLAERLAPGDAAWAARWRGAEAAARTRLAAWADAAPWSESLAAHLAVNHPGFPLLHLASSMAVRHANLHLAPAADRLVTANRGVNGIDGTLGTFLGAALASGRRGLCLCGDLALLHDLPALLGAAQRARGAIVVLNNDGGGIFDHLPVAAVPGYHAWVRTPHGLSFADLARQFALGYARVADRSALTVALEAAASGDGLTLIECSLNGLDAVAERRRALGCGA